MGVSNGSRRLVGLSLACCLLGGGTGLAQQPAAMAPSAGPSQLQWTPHRAATTTVATETPAPAAATGVAAKAGDTSTAKATTASSVAKAPAPVPPAAATAAPLTPPPASVGLPADVPAVAPARRPRSPQPQQVAAPRPRPAAPTGDWRSDNRLPGRFRASTPNDGQFSLPGLGDVSVFRSPQGEAGRPVLAVEGTPVRPANVAAAPLGGGLAPRFNPTTTSQAPRRERLAMNADGLPSVMARAPQAAAIDDTSVPGRLPASPGAAGQTLPPPAARSITGADDPSIVINTMPSDMTDGGGYGFGDQGYATEGFEQPGPGADGGMWMGEYPAQLHVESFYDDPFACEETGGLLTCWPHDGRFCAWLRQFGKPYYGWRWYRDFTAGAGITSFQNQSNFGLLGNYGTNEYLNWAMPFWNAFGIGWQLGARAVQTNFQQPTFNDAVSRLPGNSRQQVFVTTGFFTRAFEGRGLQGGAVYDYLSDSYFENVDVAQIRGELSYVWGYHELGFWGAFNAMEQIGSFSPASFIATPGVASTVDLYTAFYRLHFGDANEARIWGGASGNGQGVVGSTVRAPMARSLAMEGSFTYLLPASSQTVPIGPAGTTSVTYAPSAWNLSVNLVWYPAGRARRSLASPYRPLFDVADNGSMIRSLARLPTP